MQALDGHSPIRTALKALIPRAVNVKRLRRRARNAVLLTFDDGPDPEVTPAVLERLDAYGARAVFFVVGRRVKRAPHLLTSIAERGHLIGNHSHLHRPGYVSASGPQPRFGQYYEDCKRCQDVIEQHTASRPRLFRPPGGRLTWWTLLVPRLLGLRCVTWSAEVRDWRFRSAAEALAGAEALARFVVPRDIILLHDDNPCVLDLLDAFLPSMQDRRIDLASGVRFI